MIKGMSRHTGKTIRDDGQLPTHLQQSLHDILSTLIGTRICRRHYGSLLPHLIDQPCNDITKLKIMNASATAIIRFEPRLKIKQVQVSSADRQNAWDVTLIGTYSQYNQDQTFKQSYTFGAAA
ncbi:Lysozyme [compost metagenome]